MKEHPRSTLRHRAIAARLIAHLEHSTSFSLNPSPARVKSLVFERSRDNNLISSVYFHAIIPDRACRPGLQAPRSTIEAQISSLPPVPRTF